MAMELPWNGVLAPHARLIEIDTALPAALMVERFEGREAVCEDFNFQIDCLSASAFLEAHALVGNPLSLRLALPAGGHRHWHGHCTQVAPLGSDGGLARYRLTMQPWTAFLALRRNATIFQDTDALGAIERVFADHPQAAYRIEVTQSLPVFALITQFRETDHAFVFRLLADAGLAWRFEHAQNGDARHTLVIVDRDAQTPLASPSTLRFHRVDATESLDAITQFGEQRQVVPDTFTTASWQADEVEAVSATLQADAVGPAEPSREVFTVPRAARFARRADADQHAGLQLDALRLPQRLHAGAGSGRGLQPGAAFTLIQHPDLSGQAFAVLVIEHVAANNALTALSTGLGSGIVALLDDADTERGSYRNRFVAVAAGTPIVPLARFKPTAPGMQTAIVVGLPGAAQGRASAAGAGCAGAAAAVTSTRDHQVRIQFGWQRGAAPNPGGLTDAGSSTNPDAAQGRASAAGAGCAGAAGHAPGDDTSGAWVRVAEWLTGPNWGSHALPRIGSEVLVEFLHGDIDQPIVTGQLYNGQVAPPFALGDGAASAGAAASNHPGTLSGLHTQSLDGSGTQQWVIDDAPGQLRQRLHTSLADSKLEIGYLIDHADGYRGGLRGQGFDLATLGWGNLRAGHGVLLSTSARKGATSTQLDAAEAVSQLKAAADTAQVLSDAAGQHHVTPLSANAQQTAFTAMVDPEQDGKYTGSVGGQATTKPTGNARDGGSAVERFAQPVLLAESPDRIALTSPKSALAYAGGNVHLTAQSDAHLAAGHTFAGVAGGPLALFAQKGPIRTIAANGPVTLQAHAGPLEILADQSVTITATDERIDVLAKQKIVLQAGQTQITLEGGDITFACPGTFTVKAGQVPFKGGARERTLLARLPHSTTKLFDEGFILVNEITGQPISGRKYKIFFEDGTVEEGVSNAKGRTHNAKTQNEEPIRIEVEG